MAEATAAVAHDFDAGRVVVVEDVDDLELTGHAIIARGAGELGLGQKRKVCRSDGSATIGKLIAGIGEEGKTLGWGPRPRHDEVVRSSGRQQLLTRASARVHAAFDSRKPSLQRLAHWRCWLACRLAHMEAWQLGLHRLLPLLVEVVLIQPVCALPCCRSSRDREQPLSCWRIVLGHCKLMEVLGAREDQLEQALGHFGLVTPAGHWPLRVQHLQLLACSENRVLIHSHVSENLKVHPLTFQLPEA